MGLHKSKGIFKPELFGPLKTDSGAFLSLVQFVCAGVNAAIKLAHG